MASVPHGPISGNPGHAQPSGVPDCGVLVLAYGHRRYQSQAQSLALSLQRHSPGIHRTLVTDDVQGPATQAYDSVIQVETGQPDDCGLKLNLDTYAPYPRTLYIDADVLAVRPIDLLFDIFDGSDVGLVGRDISSAQEERWYGDVASMCRIAGTDWLPKFNSGLLLIRTTEVTRQVFSRAREFAHEYNRLGLHPFRGGIADEPLLAMALAGQGIHAQDLTAVAAATPIGINGPLRVNALAGQCAFTKQGLEVEPVLIHFAADYSSDYRLAGAHYRRERLALRLSQCLGAPDSAARIAAGLRYGVQCAAFNTWIRVAGRAPRDPSGIFGTAKQPFEVPQ